MAFYLQNLRHSWRVRTGLDLDKDGPMTSLMFIGRFGNTARFHHVGLDRRAALFQGTPASYGHQLYAVFSARDEKGSHVIPFTPLDIDHLAHTLQGLPAGYTNRAALVTRLQGEIAVAVANLEAHKTTFARLNPEAAHYLEKFNRV